RCGARAFPGRADRGARVTVRGRDAMLAPLQDALRDVKADEAELHVHRRRSAISRYAKNQIHQNAVADETLVQARVVVAKAVGIASANSLDPADLRRLIADATAAARESAPNADWPGLAEPARMSEPKAYDAETARADARSQADAIKRITAAAKERAFRAAGTHQIELTEDALANTNGVATYAPSTMAYLRALVTSDTGTGWAEDLGWSARSLDPSDVAAGAVHDRQSARWFDTRSTGHAADPRRYSVGGHAGNLTMAGGDAKREQLIRATRRGVLITRFHYTNTPDPKRATMTGTTRDG